MEHRNTWLADEMTPWFSGLKSPVRPGLYEIILRSSAENVWAQFLEGRWRFGSDRYAINTQMILPAEQIKWRGLVEEAVKRAEHRYAELGRKSVYRIIRSG